MEGRQLSSRSDEVRGDGLGRLSLLASALSGRSLRVAPGERGEPAWTDGATVFVDADTSTRDQLAALAVQGSLLAAGSLEPDVVRRLTRRPALARRYLAVEGHRALATNEHLLPLRLRSLIDRTLAVRSDSPAASIAVALSRETIADPPDSFGAIRARHLLASDNRGDASATTREHAWRQQQDQVLVELEEDESDEVHTADPFSSPVGGGGALGRLLQRMLRMVRSLGRRGAGRRRTDASNPRRKARRYPCRVLDRKRRDPGGRRHRRPGDEIPGVGR